MSEQTGLAPAALLLSDNLPAEYYPQVFNAYRFSDVFYNRIDLLSGFEAFFAGAQCVFCDFEGEFLERTAAREFVIVLPKEKLQAIHLINSAAHLLLRAGGGRIALYGEKSSGIKTYAKNIAIASAGMCDLSTHKNGNLYHCSIRIDADLTAPLLAPKPVKKKAAPAYDALTKVELAEDMGALLGRAYFYSKPGQFGWDKIDAGSLLLINELLRLDVQFAGQNIVDLGAGYGLLSLFAAHQAQLQSTHKGAPAAHLVASDNNAAALVSCAKNLDQQVAIDFKVLAADAGDALPSASASIVVCNPPFHSGRQQDFGLSEKFLAAMWRLLKRGGHAYVVVNQFVPLKRLAQPQFKVQSLANEQGFAVFALQKN